LWRLAAIFWITRRKIYIWTLPVNLAKTYWKLTCQSHFYWKNVKPLLYS
jgi:hypothetical protein